MLDKAQAQANYVAGSPEAIVRDMEQKKTGFPHDLRPVCATAHRLRDEATAHNLEPTVASLGRATVI